MKVLTLHISIGNSILFLHSSDLLINVINTRVCDFFLHYLIQNKLFNKRLNCVNFPTLDKQKIQFNSL